MTELKVRKIIKKGTRIEVEYEQQGLDEYINTTKIPYWEYECNIENVPNSVAIVPFLTNFLALIFVLNVDVYLPEIDKAFYDCICDYRDGYKKLIPMINFGGNIYADKIVENCYEHKKNCLLFSGGIDATNSLAINDDLIDDCITIWGADIRSENFEGWEKMSASVADIINKYSKKWIVIKSNFRDYYNEKTLGNVVKDSGDNWWHGFQHGVALLGQTAPIAYINGYEKILIASSFTKEFRAVCASDPLTDNCFKVGSSYAVHDGYQYDRCQKVKNIFESINKKNIILNLHVCWESKSGKNCGHCEKCIRSYLNCRAVNCDSHKIGLYPTVSMNEIKRIYYYHTEFNKNAKYRTEIIRRNAKATYGDSIPEDLQWLMNLDMDRINNSFYWKLKRVYRRIKVGLKNKLKL